MARPLWIGALVGVLACTAPGWAQGQPQESLITVREPNKPEQQCRVLKCWREKDGSKLYQVQDVKTGEIMMIHDPELVSGASVGSKVKAAVAGVFGSSKAPPAAPSTPAPPIAAPIPDKAVASAPVEPAKPGNWRESWGKVEPWTAEDTKKAVAQASSPPPAPSRKSTPLAAPDANDPIQHPDVYLKSLPGVAAEKPAPSTPPLSPAPKPEVTVLSSIPPADPGEKPVTDAPPPVQPQATAPPPARVSSKGFLARLFGHTSPAPAPPVKAPAASDASPPKPPIAQPTSGGTPEPPPAASGPNQKAVAAGPKAAPPRGLLVRLFGESTAKPDVGVASTGKSGAEVALPESPASSPTHIPMGMSSILAVQSPLLTKQEPVGQMVVWEGQPVILPGKTATQPSIPVTASNAFTLNVPQGAMPASMAMPGADGAMVMGNAPMLQANVPEGMNNAFTTGGTTRPIPADNGMAYQSQNAFQQPGVSGAVRLPVMQPTQLAYGPPPMMAQQRMPAYYPARMPASSPEPQTVSLLRVLRDALPPSEREMAVESLTRCDWHSNPNVPTGLMTAAKTDPAATVRACCVRALAKMKVNTAPVLQTVQALRNDSDSHVREECVQALAVLKTP